MLRFKVGDIVKVKENLKSDCCYGSTRFVPRMLKYRGGAFTVKAIWNERYALRGCWNDDEEIYWDFSDEMLEPIISTTDVGISFDVIVADTTTSHIIETVLIDKVRALIPEIDNSCEMQIMTDCLVSLMQYAEEEVRNNG